jgi:hypothetical protein
MWTEPLKLKKHELQPMFSINANVTQDQRGDGLRREVLGDHRTVARDKHKYLRRLSFGFNIS